MSPLGFVIAALYFTCLAAWFGGEIRLAQWAAILGVDGFSLLSLSVGALCLVCFERKALRRGLSLLLFSGHAFTLSLLMAPSIAGLEGVRWAIGPVLGAGWMAFAAAGWWSPEERESGFEPGALAAWIAMACGALLILSRVYGADQLLGASESSSVLESLAFLACAVVLLARYQAPSFAGLASGGAAGELRRHLLPPSLLIPVSIGGAMMLARAFVPALSFSSVVALGVLANLCLNLWVLNRAGEQLRLLDRRRQEKQAAKEERVRKQGQRDSVTKLLNRAGWDAEVRQAESLCRKKKLEACVFIIDLDGLKQINDTEGHQAGDAFILQAAQALKRVARQKDSLARLGGDEFGYLAVGCDDQGALALQARLTKALDDAGVPASLGYAIKGRGKITDAIERADEAMYAHKKERGGGRR